MTINQKLFSFCSLITDKDEYNKMKFSFIKAGFNEKDCEYLLIDNSEFNRLDAYNGLNELLAESNGKYIICCHQDIRLSKNNRVDLENQIVEMNKYDPKWAVLANCGGGSIMQYALRVSEGDGKEHNTMNFPFKVKSVDEHFFLIKRDATLKFTKDIFSGFHFYGTDICCQATLHGFTAYAIDFHVEHFGGGSLNAEFYNTKKLLIRYYEKQLNLNWVQTTCTRMFISKSKILNRIMNFQPVRYLAKKIYQKIRI